MTLGDNHKNCWPNLASLGVTRVTSCMVIWLYYYLWGTTEQSDVRLCMAIQQYMLNSSYWNVDISFMIHLTFDLTLRFDPVF